MGKKYIMFVDERGFLSTDINNNFSMVGVIFEYDYCVNLKNKQCELKTKLNQYKKEVFGSNSYNVFLDDVMLKETVIKKIDEKKRKEFVNELPLLFKSLKFTIISSAMKQDVNNVKESYSIATKNLLESYYSFIMKKNGEVGGIIMEARDKTASHIIQQSFFDVYSERSKILSRLEGIQDKINTFIVSEKDNETYGSGLEVSNIVNNILFRVSNGLREIDSKLISYVEYGDKEKIFKEVKSKIYKYALMEVSNKQLGKISYNSTETFGKELKTLRKQLKIKDTKINEKQKEINQLANEIQLLNQQLEEALLSRKSDNVIFKILSDIDFKMKGIENKARVAEN